MQQVLDLRHNELRTLTLPPARTHVMPGIRWFDVPGPWNRFPLFDVNSAMVQDIATTVRSNLKP